MNVATLVPTSDGMNTVYGGFAQVLAGVHGGYDYQLNNIFVVGVEGDITHKSGSGTLLSRVALPTSEWDGSIRGRLGVLVTPHSLVYATGGFAFGSFKTPWHEVPASFEAGEAIELLGGYRTGWTLGGGIQYTLDSNWSTRIDYRYTDWGSKGVLWAEDEEVSTVPSASKLTETRVTVGLTYKHGPSAKIGERDAVQANWAGTYVGGHVGAAAARIKYGAFTCSDGCFDDTEFADFTQVFAGGFVGYNYLVSSKIVLGVEGDLNAKFGKGYKIDDRLLPTSDWDSSLRARLGYAPTARSLIYATGGLAFGHFKTPQSGAQERQGGNDVGNQPCRDQVFGPSGPGCPSEPAEDHVGGFRTGWTLGAGLEYAINQNWSTRIDYRYTDYGSKTTTVNTGYNFDTYPSKLTENRIGVGVGYRFAGDAAPIRARY
jgi:outer membrane immunogenic protein